MLAVKVPDDGGTTQSDMEQEQYKPAGYCPHCGYAIDPGTCPECGKTVTAGELDASPYWVTRRRRIRRALWLTLAVGCVVGGVWLYRNPSVWLPYVPTRVLLMLQGDDGSLTITELVQRLNAGTLTQAQADKMLDQLLLPEGLTIRSPHPRDTEMQLGLTLLRKADWRGWQLWVDSSQACVDGVPAPWIHDQPTRQDWRYGSDARAAYRITFHSSIRPLAVGDHEVRWRIVFSLKPDATPVSGPSPTCSKTLTAHVRVEDKLLDQFVRPVVDAAIAEQMRQRIGLTTGISSWISGEHVQAYGDVVVEAPPIALAADLQARPTAGDEYSHRCDLLCLKAKNYRFGFWTLGPADTLSVGSRVDVRLVPNPVLAFHAGLEQYFGGMIEWEGVIVKDQSVGSLTGDLKSGLYFPPTRISTSLVSGTATQPG